MISQKQIKKIKIKLSLLFALIVFFITLISWVFFIIYREYNFDLATKNELNSQYEKIKDIKKFNTWDEENRMFINLIIKNSKDQKEIFNKIDDWIPYFIISQIDSFFSQKKNWFVEQEINWEFYKILKKTEYNDIIKENADYYLIKKIWTKTNLTFLIFSFIFFNLFLSFLFYIIWYFLSNENLKPIEQNVQELENFIRDAWHELKTPISAIYSSLSLAKKIWNYEEAVKESIPIVLDMEKIVDWLLKLANITKIKSLDNLEISKEILNTVKIYQEKIKEKNLDLKLELLEWVFFEVNKEYIAILLANLVSNAIKYNKENWKIIIWNTKKSFYIEDTWIWIKKDSQKKIFDRFYREDEARANTWFWIWLSLVKKIITIYNFDIKLDSETEKWTRIEIFFRK